MRANYLPHWLALLIIVPCLLAAVACSGNLTETSTARDYPVYFWDSDDRANLLVYQPTTGRLDSVALPCSPTRGLTVSPSGHRLYLATDSAIVVVGTEHFTPVATLPYPATGPVAVSPNGNRMAIMGDSLIILRLPDYAVIYRDTIAPRKAVFSDDSRTLVCTGGPNDHYLALISFESDTITSEIIPTETPPTCAVPTPDGRQLLVYFKEDLLLSRMAVLDLIGGGELYSEFIFPGEGTISRPFGWDRAVYTNPGSFAGQEGSSSFKLFDFDDCRPGDEINTRRAGPSPEPESFPVGQVAITPDHRWLVALDAQAPHRAFLYDLKEERFAGWIDVGRERSFAGLAVQSHP